MRDRALPAPVDVRQDRPSDSGDSFHGFLLNRSACAVAERKKMLAAAIRARRLRAARLVAGFVFFAGGGLLGSGITLVAEGNRPLGLSGALAASGLAVACAGLFTLQKARPDPAVPAPSPA